jgi:hypothetical protein
LSASVARIAPSAHAAPLKNAPFAWGVTGHPNAQEGYPRETFKVQLDLVHEAGMRWYRCDLPQTHFEKSPQIYDELLSEAKKRGVNLLPILFPDVAKPPK